MTNIEFQTGVIRPVECLREGWELIKDRYWLFFGITLVGMLIGGFVPLGILLGAMMCGIYYALSKKTNGEHVEFGDLFKGFDYFLPSLIVTLFVVVPAFLLWIVMYIPMIGMQIYLEQSRGKVDFNDLFPFLIVLGVLVFIITLLLCCLHALIMFAYPLIVEHKLTGVEAFKLSARAALKNLGGVVGLILCEFALGFLGYLLCIVGVYLTIPIMFAGAFVAYRKVFPAPNRQQGAPFTTPPPPPDFTSENAWK